MKYGKFNNKSFSHLIFCFNELKWKEYLDIFFLFFLYLIFIYYFSCLLLQRYKIIYIALKIINSFQFIILKWKLETHFGIYEIFCQLTSSMSTKEIVFVLYLFSVLMHVLSEYLKRYDTFHISTYVRNLE